MGNKTPVVTETGLIHTNNSTPNIRWAMAAAFADGAHRAVNQLSKYTREPYINHPRRVVAILIRHGVLDEATIEAAWLHDVVEDTRVTKEDILTIFGEEVHYIVSEVTENDYPAEVVRADRKLLERKRWRNADERVKNLKCADLIDNGESIVKHDPAFAITFMNEARLALSDLEGACESLLNELRNLVGKYFETDFAVRVGQKYYRTKIIQSTSGVYMGAKARGSELRIRIRKPMGMSTSQLGDLFAKNIPISITADCKLYIGSEYFPDLDVEFC